MKGYLIAAICGVAVAVSGCETIGPTSSDLAAVEAGTVGAVMLDYKEFNDLYGYTVYIADREAGEVVGLTGTNNPGSWIGNKSVAVEVVKPGTYEIIKGSLANYNTTANMPLLDLWFAPFVVDAGEFVNLGQLVMEEVNVSSIQKHEQGIVGDLLGLKDSEKGVTFIKYKIEPVDSVRYDAAFEKYPALSGLNPVERTPKLLISDDEFEAAARRAYAPDENGQPPLEEDARNRMVEELIILVMKDVDPS